MHAPIPTPVQISEPVAVRKTVFLLPLVALTSLACLWFGRATPAPLPAPQQTATAIWALEPCSLSLFSPAVRWSSQGDALSAELALTNGANTACRLRGAPQLAISDAGGQILPVELAPGSEPTADPFGNAFVLASRQEANVRLVWRNYCGPQPLGGLFFTLSLPDHPGQITFETTDPSGLPAFSPPPCTDPGVPSTLTLDWLSFK